MEQEQKRTGPQKPIIGFTVGDGNGIGPELVVKVLADNRVMDLCTPVIFGSAKLINFYRKTVSDSPLNYQVVKDLSRPAHRQINLLPCWEEDFPITPGELTEAGGQMAIRSLTAAAEALRDGRIDGMVTAPIHKSNTESPAFPYTGHTPYLRQYFGVHEVVMLMTAGALRVGLVTEHLPLSEVAAAVTRERILSKLTTLHNSLVRDFGIDRPKIAVLGLNPHAGDGGLIGEEEEKIIKPAVKEARNKYLVSGPFSADAFFARGQHERFDAVLAMYHDQGLIPFKSLAREDGINFTAGLPVIRTSPDHGTAFDIAGKNRADHSSMLSALFNCIDIIRNRKFYDENRKNPLKKITSVILANAVDEAIDDSGEEK